MRLWDDVPPEERITFEMIEIRAPSSGDEIRIARQWAADMVSPRCHAAIPTGINDFLPRGYWRPCSTQPPGNQRFCAKHGGIGIEEQRRRAAEKRAERREEWRAGVAWEQFRREEEWHDISAWAGGLLADLREQIREDYRQPASVAEAIKEATGCDDPLWLASYFESEPLEPIPTRWEVESAWKAERQMRWQHGCAWRFDSEL